MGLIEDDFGSSEVRLEVGHGDDIPREVSVGHCMRVCGSGSREDVPVSICCGLCGEERLWGSYGDGFADRNGPGGIGEAARTIRHRLVYGLG